MIKGPLRSVSPGAGMMRTPGTAPCDYWQAVTLGLSGADYFEVTGGRLSW